MTSATFEQGTARSVTEQACAIGRIRHATDVQKANTYSRITAKGRSRMETMYDLLFFISYIYDRNGYLF